MNSRDIAIEHHPLSGNRKYRHTPWLAARTLGIPQSYVWVWIAQGLLKTGKFLRKRYVSLVAVQKVIDSDSVFEAANLTGEPIPEPLASEVRNRLGTAPGWLERLLATPEEGQ